MDNRCHAKFTQAGNRNTGPTVLEGAGGIAPLILQEQPVITEMTAQRRRRQHRRPALGKADGSFRCFHRQQGGITPQRRRSPGNGIAVNFSFQTVQVIGDNRKITGRQRRGSKIADRLTGMPARDSVDIIHAPTTFR